jgi:predicted phosphodiesterase
MINKIAHLSDIHLNKIPTRNPEYEEAFENLYKSLEEQKPDIITIVGDLFNDFLDLQSEQILLAKHFLVNLAKIAPVRITRGNHDVKKKNLKRVDSIEAIVKIIDNPNIIYYNETNFFEDDNIIWAVWHYGDKNNNPWKLKQAKDIELKRKTGNVIIDLFHEDVKGSKYPNGLVKSGSSLLKIDEFKGDYSFFGHIHLQQYLDTAHRKAYSSSLIAQAIDEGDANFHGYILWDISKGTSELMPIATSYSFHNVNITPYTDFDDLDYVIDNPTKFMKIRFIWNTLPSIRNKDNERKLSEYYKKLYPNITIAHKNNFVVEDNIDVNENIALENVTDIATQHEIFTDYLTKIGIDADMIADILKLDDEISSQIDIDATTGGEWDVIKFGCENFMSYEKFDIDWRNMDGLFQITGKNKHGKTTIFKTIAYLLYGKTPETESRMEFGDKRFVNNRNGAKYCSGYIVIAGNGEYYGIKRRTDLKFNKDGQINGAPTKLDYFLLKNPDDDMNDETSIEKLDEERKSSTQNKIDNIIGSYKNFMRVVMTTSDTLNNILSNDMAVFIDSILFDSGLDIFDLKLKGLKAYTDKKANEIRYSCNIEETNKKNEELKTDIDILETEINELTTIKIPNITTRIVKGREYIETQTKKLYKINEDIYNLDVEETQESIDDYNENINEINDRLNLLNTSIKPLCEIYDIKRLEELTEKKDTHKTKVYESNLEIKKFEQYKRDEDHANEIIRGDIVNLNKSGVNKKEEILKLSKSKTCPTCGQKMGAEHQTHINTSIEAIKKEMFTIAADIKTKEDLIPVHNNKIVEYDLEIQKIKNKITKMTEDMEIVLVDIGTLTNLKNDSEKRKEMQIEIDNIPIKIQNKNLNIDLLQKKIDDHHNSLLQIEENQKTEKIITTAKEKIALLEADEIIDRNTLHTKENSIKEKKQTIENNNDLLVKFKEQEYGDNVIARYKSCVHRDGLPKQMLSNYILPKINVTLEEILSVAEFKIWLDENDLKPKLVYNNRPNAIIDCISGSGAERTFSAVPLKYALNLINIKAKPNIFLLDEVMGKLDEESTDQFVEMLKVIKQSIK